MEPKLQPLKQKFRRLSFLGERRMSRAELADHLKQMKQNALKRMFRKHHYFLKMNIVVNDELVAMMESQHVITPMMAAELQQISGRRQKVEKLIEFWSLRTKPKLLTLCGILQLNNQTYLSSFLRQALCEDEDELQQVEIDELFRRYPRLNNQIRARDVPDLLNIILEKAKELSVQKDWSVKHTDKERLMEARQKQLEENFRFTEVLREKDEVINELGETIDRAVTDAEKKGVSLAHVRNYMKDLQESHKQEISKQMKFNAANDSSLARQQQKQAEMEAAFRQMVHDIKHTLEDYPASSSLRASSSENMRARLGTIDEQARYWLDKLLALFTPLLEIEKRYKDLKDASDYGTSLLGSDPRSVPITEAVQQYMVDSDERRLKLTTEVETLRKQVAEMKEEAVHRIEEINAELEHKEVEMHRMKAEVVEKDKEAWEIRMEMEKLRKRCAKLMHYWNNLPGAQKVLKTRAVSVDEREGNITAVGGVTTQDLDGAERSAGDLIDSKVTLPAIKDGKRHSLVNAAQGSSLASFKGAPPMTSHGSIIVHSSKYMADMPATQYDGKATAVTSNTQMQHTDDYADEPEEKVWKVHDHHHHQLTGDKADSIVTTLLDAADTQMRADVYGQVSRSKFTPGTSGTSHNKAQRGSFVVKSLNMSGSSKSKHTSTTPASSKITNFTDNVASDLPRAGISVKDTPSFKSPRRSVLLGSSRQSPQPGIRRTVHGASRNNVTNQAIYSAADGQQEQALTIRPLQDQALTIRPLQDQALTVQPLRRRSNSPSAGTSDRQPPWK